MLTDLECDYESVQFHSEKIPTSSSIHSKTGAVMLVKILWKLVDLVRLQLGDVDGMFLPRTGDKDLNSRQRMSLLPTILALEDLHL